MVIELYTLLVLLLLLFHFVMSDDCIVSTYSYSYSLFIFLMISLFPYFLLCYSDNESVAIDQKQDNLTPHDTKDVPRIGESSIDVQMRARNAKVKLLIIFLASNVCFFVFITTMPSIVIQMFGFFLKFLTDLLKNSIFSAYIVLSAAPKFICGTLLPLFTHQERKSKRFLII